MKYSINDRVAVYENGVRFIGNVTKILEDKIEVWIVDTFGICKAFVYVHEKQIRKLKPKKKAREWWFKFNTSNYTITFNNETFYSAVQVVSVKPHNLDGWIHVKEVLK